MRQKVAFILVIVPLIIAWLFALWMLWLGLQWALGWFASHLFSPIATTFLVAKCVH